MGCNASKLDSLPAVSLCHHRFHLIDDSLRHSYSFSDSHLSYLNSLHSFPAALLSFLRHNSAITTSSNIVSTSDSPPIVSDDHTHRKSDSSSDLNFSSSSSDSLSDDKGDNNDAYDFHHLKYDAYGGGGRGDVSYSWKTPSPPPPRVTSAWDFLNFFDAAPFERYDFAEKDKEETNTNHTVELKSNVKKKKLNVEKKSKKIEESKDSCPKHRNHPVEKKKEEKDEVKKKAELEKVMEEVEASFQKAAECGKQLLSKSCSFPCGFDGDDDLGVSSLSLSSTLSRLCMWEKKLYDEVKAEEKLRMAYAKCCNKMRKASLSDTSKASEEASSAERVDESVRSTLRTLANQIQVGIQVIDRISTNINKLRDDELFLQLKDLIHKLFVMWESMLESHRSLLQAVSESQNLLVLSSTKLSDAGLESAIQLKIEVQSFALRFISWVSSQKRCVKSLNGWLMKCLLPDKPAEKQAYPPVFALCEKWSSSLDAVSETEVIDAIQSLIGAVNKLLEREHVHVQERMTADKEMDRKMKALEKEEQRLKKLLHSHGFGKVIDRKTEGFEFEFGLKQVFKAMERFSATSFEAYRQLHEISVSS
ncbi:Protein ALTERED PHOSPHATE STARVATION RESPONSE 1 [Linum grandiflorum]